jgi:hypothetical protein
MWSVLEVSFSLVEISKRFHTACGRNGRSTWPDTGHSQMSASTGIE